MGIGSIKAPGGAMDRQRETVQREKTVQQGAAAQPVDAVSRNIRNEISEVQRQKQGLSSKREMPADERSEKQQELQHELSTLNTRLRQRQTEVQREQKREDRSEKLSVEDTDGQASQARAVDAERIFAAGETSSGTVEKKDAEESPDTEEKKENLQTVSRKEEKDKGEKPGGIDFARDELHSVAAGSIAKEQIRRRDAVISKMEGGIVILRGEIRQDELRGGNADRKRAELKMRQEKMRNAASDIPEVKAPFAKKEESGRNAGRTKEEAEAREVRRSRDGVVVITHNAPWNQIR